MDTATTEEKFLHAVELIKNLPKTGSIHPSNDMKLKFYSYFKQATEGPCSLPKPGFWDVVSRAKWDAWNRLGNMPKDDAMNGYVNEFVQILKTTPFDESAHNYAHLMGPYIDFAPVEFVEKYKAVNGSVNKLPHVPACNSEAICENIKDTMPHNDQNKECIEDDSYKYDTPVNGHYTNGATESDSDEFSDFYDNANGGSSDELALIYDSKVMTKDPYIIQMRGGGERRFVSSDANPPIPGSENRGNRNNRGRVSGDSHPHGAAGNNSFSSGSGGRRNSQNFNVSQDVNETLAYAVLRLQHTMEQVVNRLDSLEALLQAQNTISTASSVKKSFWSILGIPHRAAIFLLVWPFIVNALMYIAAQKRRRK